MKIEIMSTDQLNGGFGLLDLEKVITGIRLRRLLILESGFDHPIGELQNKLGSYGFFREAPKFNIDPTTTTALKNNL